MGQCPGLHCPGCGKGTAKKIGILAAAVVAAIVAAAFLAVIDEAAGLLTGAVYAVLACVVVRAWRKARREGRALLGGPLAVWHVIPQKSRAEVYGSYRPRPVPVQATRPARALPAEAVRRQAITDRRTP